MSKPVGKLSFRCTGCGKEHPASTTNWRCPDCGGPFILSGTPSFAQSRIKRQDFSLWRYREFLRMGKPVSLGEGLTPLVKAKGCGVNALYKLEFLSPTGSFKDRAVCAMVSFLRSIGIGVVVEDSSGNAAASLSAYSARAGIRAKIFVPAYASPAKLRQIEIYGAELVSVAGTRIEATRAAEAAAQAGAYYASHYWNPVALEGLKTFAYELAEQLHWRCPDNLVVPCGHGTLLLGAYYGFRALAQSGVTTRMPRLFAVQAVACAPIVEAFDAGRRESAPVEAGETVAEGIRITEPVRSREILTALDQTQGRAVSVDEEEIQQARRQLVGSGLFVELTSAVAAAGLKRLVDGGVIGPDECTVVALTGSGLKNLSVE